MEGRRASACVCNGFSGFGDVLKLSLQVRLLQVNQGSADQYLRDEFFEIAALVTRNDCFAHAAARDPRAGSIPVYPR